MTAFRALYRSATAGDALDDLAVELEADEALPPDVRDFALHLVTAVARYGDEIDDALRAALSARWSLERVALTDRCALRVGTAELLFSPHQPTAVVLNESIEIAKRYGSPDSGRFVNGVLDRVAKTAREGDNQD